jgi:site-specific recombinase XerD
LQIIGDITLQSISPLTIDSFIYGMSKLSNTTKGINLRHFKACINDAIRNGFVKYDVHPFALTKIPRSSVRLLDIEIGELILIKNVNTTNKKISLAHDLFLLSFYLGGINLADLVRIDFSKETISYIRKKTAHSKHGEKTITIGIPDEARPIIKKYIRENGKLSFGYKFTYDNFQRYLNRCIKDMGKQLGINTDICYYSARKTFAQFAFDLGIKTEVIEYCIGQTMKENRPIYNYVRVMQRQADMAIRKVIDYTNNPERFIIDVVVC